MENLILGKLIFTFSKDLEYSVPKASAGDNKTVILPQNSTTLDGSLSTYDGQNEFRIYMGSSLWTFKS